MLKRWLVLGFKSRQYRRDSTTRELEAVERENLRRALATCRGRISGDAGAARLLGIPPSTLSSRMKALGLKRPT